MSGSPVMIILEMEGIEMKTLGLNPYLPFWETVPDGEPHVFDGRIYIFGSHDSRNGEQLIMAVWWK